jgi:hypothetical protein
MSDRQRPANPQGLADMMTDADAAAVERVSDLLTAMIAEAQRHTGHGVGCPFDDADVMDFIESAAGTMANLMRVYAHSKAAPRLRLLLDQAPETTVYH